MPHELSKRYQELPQSVKILEKPQTEFDFFENLDKNNVLIYPFRTNYDEELKELNLFVGVRAILRVQEFLKLAR